MIGIGREKELKEELLCYCGGRGHITNCYELGVHHDRRRGGLIRGC